MAPFFMIIAFVIIVAAAWYIQTYNRFVKYRNRIEEAWSSIDVALKRRFNLIPNLIAAVKGYEDHEEGVLKSISHKIIEAPKAEGRMAEESEISGSLSRLLALAEAYPELKASGNFLSLQNQLNDVEEDILKTRVQLNGAVRRYNTLIESFPAKWLADKYGHEKKDYFTLELATQRELPEVDFS